MADLCLPLRASEDTFKLHSVQMELEAVERPIHELLGKQAQLRKRKVTLETSQADAHKSGVSMQRAANTPTTSTPCVSLHRPRAPRTRSSLEWKPMAMGAAVEDAIQALVDEFSPPVFDMSSRNRFAPLCETERDTVIIGDSIVRHVRATLAEGKVHTHCFPGALVLDVSVQILAILKDDESVAAIAAVVIDAGLTTPSCGRRRHLSPSPLQFWNWSNVSLKFRQNPKQFYFQMTYDTCLSELYDVSDIEYMAQFCFSKIMKNTNIFIRQ